VNWKAIAQAAYEEWRRQVLTDPDVCPCCNPPWSELEDINQKAWEAAVITACDIYVRVALA